MQDSPHPRRGDLDVVVALEVHRDTCGAEVIVLAQLHDLLDHLPLRRGGAVMGTRAAVTQPLGAQLVESVPPLVKRRPADAVVAARRRRVARDLLGVAKRRQAMPDLALLLSIVLRTSSHEKPRLSTTSVSFRTRVRSSSVTQPSALPHTDARLEATSPIRVMNLLIIISMLGSEEHFRTTIGPKRAAALFGALTSSSERAREVTAREGFTEGRTEPVVAFDFAVNNMADLESHPGVRMVTVQNQHFWTIDDIYAIRVKKLDANLRSANHRSEQQELISRQAVLPGLEPLIYVTAGTKYSRRTGLAEQFVVVKYCAGPMHKQRVEWLVDLEELASGGMAPVAPVLPLPSAPTAPAAVSARRAVEVKPAAGARAE